MPGGVVNLLTGLKKELVPVLAAPRRRRRDRRLGRPGATCGPRSSSLAADDIKRIARRPAGVTDAKFDWLDDRAAERPEWIAAYLEMKTVWHPIGV